jgi:teichuronic acid biosynthesis glycosyltransferase TuaH
MFTKILRRWWRKLPYKFRTLTLVQALLYKSLRFRYKTKINRKKLYEFNKLYLEEIENQVSIISWPTYDWNIPLMQRPQHIARSLGMSDKINYIFTTRNHYDNLKLPLKISKNLLLHCDFWSIAHEIDYIHIYATDPQVNLRIFKKIEKLGKKIIYEILDDFSPDLQGGNSRSIRKRHIYALRSSRVNLIVATSQKLLNSAIVDGANAKDIAYIPNACDTQHFELKKARLNEKLVIGYFGALASWFDYEILEYIVKHRPEWTIKLIGIDYDGSLIKSNILRHSNILYLGVIPYGELPKNIDFDVAILPFKINQITIHTSPVKIYEYLASGFPVVSTSLPECQNIPDVTLAKNAEEFLRKIEFEAKTDTDSKRRERRKYAQTQSWDKRAATIIDFLERP